MSAMLTDGIGSDKNRKPSDESLGSLQSQLDEIFNSLSREGRGYRKMRLKPTDIEPIDIDILNRFLDWVFDKFFVTIQPPQLFRAKVWQLTCKEDF